MFWLIVLLTVLLVLDCLFLVLLVLVQLPKKEAGLGQAFGSGTTDALFGAGSGNALTKLTKYFTAGFFILTLSLSILKAQQVKSGRLGLERAMEKAAASESAAVPAPSAPAAPTPTTTSPVTLTTPTNLVTPQPSTGAVPQATTNATTVPTEKK